ncbi:MAG: DNA polymerase I [Ignavibacteriales bacterium]|nr:MAG: DNA polymerase I [Ignavibacteriales bacterium]
MSTKKKFVIIDAMALAYKAYFALINRPLYTGKKEPTSAIYGFVNQMIRILETNKPDYIAVAFDSKEKTFRHEKYEQYKATRQEMPEELIPQIQRIKDIIEAFKIPVYILPGYEADDIIGTAVKKAELLGLDSYAITPDKDYNQLITENVRIIKPGKTTDEIVIIDIAKVKEEFGIEPIQIIDYLALVGDSSDNIPGVAGIGPKKATPLLQSYKSIEDIYDNLDKIEKADVQKKLAEGKENAFLSKELARIHTDVPLDFDFDKAKLEIPDYEKLLSIFTELEFKTFYPRVKKIFEFSLNGIIEENNIKVESTVLSFDKEKVKYYLITNKKEAEELVKKLSKCSLLVFDTETDSLDTITVNLAGVSFCITAGEAYYVAVNPFPKSHDLFSKELSNRIDIKEFIDLFTSVFANEKIKKVCQNGKYDISVLRRYDMEVNNFYFDTMLASYVIDPDEKHGMDDLSEKYLNYKPIPLSSLLGAKKDPLKIFDVDLNELSNYSCEDADVTLRLFNVLSKIVDESKLNRVCYDIEFPLVKVLEDMEREGVKTDEAFLKSLSNDLLSSLNQFSAEIWKCAGESFNINSSQQLQRILFDKLGLDTGKKTKTGFSTDAKSLEALQGKHEIIDLIMKYREVQKLKSTYTDALPQLINKQTGRIHTNFNQTIAATGRLSSTNPNLQNIPIRTELGREIRKAFIPKDKNHVILSADYSQIELRIMASICGDKNLSAAFENGEDIHRSTAALVFQVPPSEVTPDMRRKAKEVNFGILYGIGAFGLKTRLGIPQSHAKEIIDNYFKTFSNVKNYMDSAIKSAKLKGYAETLTGRRRFLRNINSNNQTVRGFEERAAINMPIQGTAADMIKVAMIEIFKDLNNRKLKSKMILQVHDELVFDVHKDELEEVKALVKHHMETSFPLNVPIVAETGVGDNWLDAH